MWRLVSVVVAIIGVLLALLNTSSVTTGTFPLWHLNEEYRYSEKQIPDLAGKIAVVTGASSGLGLGTATILARHGASVIVTARSAEKCQATVEAVGYGSKCVVLELMSLAKTQSGANDILKIAPRIDYLVLNAGIMAPPELMHSDNSIEAQFATNHLGHFLVTKILLPSLRERSRVVAVSSIAHWFAIPMVDLKELNEAANYRPFVWYGWSKLCNLLFVSEFARKYSIAAHAVHPGAVQGKLMRFAALPPAFISFFESLMYWKAETAALSVLRPLLDDAFSNPKSPQYFVPIARIRTPSPLAQNLTLATELWDFSEALLVKNNIVIP